MKKLATFALAVVLGAILGFAAPVHAQYAPPILPGSQSTVGFWAAGKTSAITASGTSGRIALSVPAVQQVQVYNASTTTAAFVAFGDITITASAGSAGTSTSDYVIAPGAVIVLTVPKIPGVVYAAVVGSGLVYFTPGLGL